MSVVVTSQYPEAGVGAIAADLARSNLLRAVLIPRRALRRPSAMVPPLLRGGRVGARLLDSGYPAELDSLTVGLMARRQLVGLALSGLGVHAASSRYMYTSKRLFDRAAAGWVSRFGRTGDTVLAVSGAAAETFRVAKQLGMGRILHFVNAHPIVHNRILQSQAGLGPGHHELIPDEAVRSVLSELELASTILVPSQVTRMQLLEHGVDGRRIQLIRYGASDRGVMRQQISDKSGPDVLFIGQISYRKGVHLLLTAAKAVPHRRFTMVGPVVSRELLAELPLNVEYLSPRDGGQLAPLIACATVGVMPSLEDSFPLAVLEMMRARLPVVMSDATGTAELVDSGVSGWIFPSNNSDALTESLSLAVSTTDEVISARAHDAVAVCATWERFVSDVRDVVATVSSQVTK